MVPLRRLISSGATFFRYTGSFESILEIEHVATDFISAFWPLVLTLLSKYRALASAQD
jgi:hypothetical protein